MPLQLKATYVHMFTITVICAVYGWWTFGVVGIEYFSGPDALQRIGRAIAILIAAGYAFEWLSLIFAAVFSSKVLKNKVENDYTVDERDRKILHQSIYNSHFVLCGGLFLSIGALALGWSAFWVFNFIILAFVLSVVMELGTKLFLYKRDY